MKIAVVETLHLLKSQRQNESITKRIVVGDTTSARIEKLKNIQKELEKPFTVCAFPLHCCQHRNLIELFRLQWLAPTAVAKRLSSTHCWEEVFFFHAVYQLALKLLLSHTGIFNVDMRPLTAMNVLIRYRDIDHIEYYRQVKLKPEAHNTSQAQNKRHYHYYHLCHH